MSHTRSFGSVSFSELEQRCLQHPYPVPCTSNNYPANPPIGPHKSNWGTSSFVFFLASSSDGIMTHNTVLMGCNGWFGESARRIILEENHFLATGFNMSEGSGLNVLGNGLPSVTDNALLRNVDIGNRESTHAALPMYS